MAKKDTTKTPRSRITSALRQLWLRSRERQTAIKRDNYTCQCCGVKQSKAKGREVAIEIHHVNKIDGWSMVCDAIYDSILVRPEMLKTLCKECHRKEHESE